MEFHFLPQYVNNLKKKTKPQNVTLKTVLSSLPAATCSLSMFC